MALSGADGRWHVASVLIVVRIDERLKRSQEFRLKIIGWVGGRSEYWL